MHKHMNLFGIFAVINIGTSAQLAVILPNSFNDFCEGRTPNPIQMFPYFGDRSLAVAASLNGMVFNKLD